MKSIAILLTVFNRKELTIKCLNNIYTQELPKDLFFTIFLTDDGSSDKTSETVKSMFPDVNIIQGSGSLYWNRGMWTAWNVASEQEFDAYLWLNNDTFLYRNSIKSLIEISEQENDESIIVGAIKSTKETETTYGGYVKEHRLDPNGELQKVEYFNGNVVFIPKYVYDIVGNLDYRYRHSFGDFDYGLSAGKRGIASYLTAGYVGECDRHEKLNDWCNPKTPLKRRVHCLFLPTGYNPQEVFYFERKHYGLFRALFHQCTLWLRTICPAFWVIIGHHAKP